MSQDKWKTYCENTKNHPPRPLLLKALSHVPHRGVAIDLGSGALNDAQYLLASNFQKVIAVDKKPVGSEIAKTFPSDRFEYKLSTLETLSLPNDTFDLVNAQYSLPFVSPSEFQTVFRNIVQSLKMGGVFAGQFFGDRDGWATNTAMTFHTKTEVETLLAPLKIISIEEEEKDRLTVAGEMKHWHVFHCIAAK